MSSLFYLLVQLFIRSFAQWKMGNAFFCIEEIAALKGGFKSGRTVY